MAASQSQRSVQPQTDLSVARLESLVEMAQLLQRQDDLGEVSRVVTQKSKTLLNADVALVLMINPRTRQTIKTIGQEGELPEHRDYHFLHNFLSGWVILNQSAFYTEDLVNDPRFEENLFQDTKVSAALCVPLRSENLLIGTLLFLRKRGAEPFSESHRAFAGRLAAVVSPFMHNAQKIREYFVSPVPPQTLISKYSACGLIGRSQRFLDLLQAIDSAARSDVRVLIEGESGTGKELIARAIHENSERHRKKFVALDCGAIPEQLIESELFGHAKGAFTGATEPHKGLFVAADGGTLFLDEVTNLPFEMQSALLRVLQEGEVRPVGSDQIQQVDVRVLSATSQSINRLVQQGKFREDLYYRLHVYPVTVPTLNQRSDDIPVLAEHFLMKFSRQQGKEIETFHPEVVEFMRHKQWQGNVRELENFVERLVTLVPKDRQRIEKGLIPPDIRREFSVWEAISDTNRRAGSLEEQVNQYERELIRQALIEAGWNQSQAARTLKISERSIRYKMAKLGIQRPTN